MDALLIQSDVRRALEEDVGKGDVTGALLPEKLRVSAEIIAREPLLLCGQAWVNAVFKALDEDTQVHWHHAEGAFLAEAMPLCTLKGLARPILTAERTALNFLQTLSGTATKTHYYVQALKGSTTRLLDTRKTIPGLRMAQKYATQCGGAINHRFGLYDAFLIKENHIKACGSIAKAVACARQAQKNLLVELEVETLEEFQEALRAKPDRIMLDNFTLEQLSTAVKQNQDKTCELEASGGITKDNIAAVAKTGVDFISIGDLTKSIEAIDLSLLIRETL